jgi:hypothetical protein
MGTKVSEEADTSIFMVKECRKYNQLYRGKKTQVGHGLRAKRWKACKINAIL